MIFAIKNLRASRVNLLMNDFAAGLPSPLSFLGLADAVARDMGLAPWSARTIPVLHSVTASQGRTKPEMENKSGIFSPIETMEDLSGTVDVSLLMDLPGCDSAVALRKAMIGRRIAGGVISNDDIRVEDVTPDGSAFRDFGRGYAMLRPDLADRRKITTGSIGSTYRLEDIAVDLFPAERPQGFGWIVPVSVGYHLIEDPETVPVRSRTRSRDVPHVFAEPVLGIAEMVSVRNQKLRKLTPEGLDALFWSWESRGNYVLGHHTYHNASSPQNIQKEAHYG